MRRLLLRSWSTASNCVRKLIIVIMHFSVRMANIILIFLILSKMVNFFLAFADEVRIFCWISTHHSLQFSSFSMLLSRSYHWRGRGQCFTLKSVLLPPPPPPGQKNNVTRRKEKRLTSSHFACLKFWIARSKYILPTRRPWLLSRN